jgi:prepilin-type processing-associated H-X9-DG protein
MTDPQLPPSSIPNEEWQRFAQTRHQGASAYRCPPKNPTSFGIKVIIVLLVPVSLVALGAIVVFSLSVVASNRANFEAKREAEKSICSSRLKQIGLAVIMYSNGNSGKPLPALDVIARAEDLSPDVLKCPIGGDPFVYLGKGMTELNATKVLAYEGSERHGLGINFLYADGLVVWRPSEESSLMIQKLESGKNPPE